MLANSKIIPGVYNFCDSWCERCLLTKRCRSFQLQQESHLHQVADPNASLIEQLTEALNLTKRYIDKLRRADASLLTDGPAEAERQTLEEQALAQKHQPQEHPVAGLASAYLKQTGAWLQAERDFLKQAGNQHVQEVKLGLCTEEQAMTQLTALKNAHDQIRWYRTLIPVKTMATLRALDEPDLLTDDPVLLDYYHGKAKLVLVSVDRSLVAWQTILQYYPEKTDSILDMLAVLTHLNQQLMALFPQARAFKRPGLD